MKIGTKQQNRNKDRRQNNDNNCIKRDMMREGAIELILQLLRWPYTKMIHSSFTEKVEKILEQPIDVNKKVITLKSTHK